MSDLINDFALHVKIIADGAKKQLDGLKKSSDGLAKSLEVTDKVSTRMSSSFGGLGRRLFGAAAAFTAIRAGFHSLVNAGKLADRLDELSTALNVNVEQLSVWGDAVELGGGTVEGFHGTVERMTAALADFATKGRSRAAPFFQALGIQMVDAKGKARNFLDILPEIATAFEKIGKSESFGIGEKMGLDTGTIMLLQKGRKEVDEVIKRIKSYGVITDKDKKIAADFNDQLNFTSLAFRALAVRANSSLLPVLEEVFKAFEKAFVYMSDHSDLVVGGLIAIGNAIAIYVVPRLLLAAAASIMAFWPIYAVAAAVIAIGAAFALIYEDVSAFLKGNRSLTGYILAKYPIITQIFENFSKVVKSLVSWFITLKDLIYNIFDTAIKNAARNIKLMIDSLTSGITKVAELYEKVKSKLGFGGGTAEIVAKTQQELSIANGSTLGAQSSNALIGGARTATRNTNVQTGDINIQTQATDNDGIANGITDSIKKQLRQSNNNFDDGIMA